LTQFNSSYLSTAFIDLFYLAQQCLRGEKVLFTIAGPDVQVTHDSLLVNNHIRALGYSSLLVKDAQGRHQLPIPIAEKRIVDLGEVGKGLLREWRIGADSQNFGILGLELLVIVRTGRLQVLDSCGSKVQDIEIDQNILSPQAAELEFSALGAV